MSELIRTLEAALNEVANFGNSKSVELLEDALRLAVMLKRISKNHD